MINKFTNILFLFILISCGNSKAQADKYIYENGNKKVELKISEDATFLSYETPTKVDFVLTGIETRHFMMVGPGIRVKGSKNGTMSTEINVQKKNIKNDTLVIKFRYKVGEEYEGGNFYIPVKSK